MHPTNKVAGKEQASRLTLWQLICLNLLSMPVALAGLVLVTFIPTYYAVDLGLGLGIVGAVFVFGRLLDVVTDPLIGYFSDQTRSKLGPRIPWMIFGLPGFCVATWLLFSPPEAVSLLYLLIASGLYFLFYTALDVPYSSIGLEISPYVNERSVIASYKALFQVIGALTAATLPLFFMGATANSLAFSSVVVAIFSILGIGLFLTFVPRRIRVTQMAEASRPAFLSSLKTTLKSRPFRFLIVAFLIVQTANSLSAGLTVLFVTHIIGAPQLIGAFVGLVIFCSALFLPVWVWVSKRYSKSKAWNCSLIMGCIALSVTPFLAQGDIIAFSLVCIFVGAAIGCDMIMPTSMLADIVYEGEKEGLDRRAGLYLAVKNSVSKLTFLAPMGLAFPVLDAVGFDSRLVDSGSGNTPNTLFVLTLFYALIPIGLRLITIFIVRSMPTFDDGIANAVSSIENNSATTQSGRI